MEWVSRIMAVAAMMVLPGLLGRWLDQRWSTEFLTLVGFAVGLTAGISYLVLLTRTKQAKDASRSPPPRPDGDEDSRT